MLRRQAVRRSNRADVGRREKFARGHVGHHEQRSTKAPAPALAGARLERRFPQRLLGRANCLDHRLKLGRFEARNAAVRRLGAVRESVKCFSMIEAPSATAAIVAVGVNV